MRIHSILAATALLTLPIAAQTVRSTVRIDTNTPTGEEPTGHTMAASGDNATILWKLKTAKTYWASSSDGNGVTWSNPVRVDDGPGGTIAWSGFDQNAPTAIAHQDHVYTFWEDDRDSLGSGNGRNVYFARSTDGGLSWETNVRIDDSFTIGDTPVREVIMAVAKNPDGFPDNDIIHIVFTVDPGTLGANLDNEIYVSTSVDGGSTFGQAVSVSTENGNGAEAYNLSAWAEDETLHVIWSDNRAGAGSDLFYRRSDDAGGTWAFDEIQLDSSGPLNGSIEYDFSVRSLGNLVVAGWQEELGVAGKTQLRIATSTDGGDTWNPDIQVGDYPVNIESPQYALFEIAANGNIIAGWHDWRTGLPEVSVAVSTDMGATYTSTQVSSGGCSYARIVPGEGGLVTMAFTGNRLGGSADQTRSTYSLDYGVTWAADFTISGTTGDSDFAEVVINDFRDNTIHAWRADDTGLNGLYASGYGAVCTGSATYRNGSGVNPSSLTALAPWMGGTLDATLDLTTTGHNLGLLVAYSTPFTFAFGGGEILVNFADPNGELLAMAPMFDADMVIDYDLPVPTDPVFCGFGFSMQGVHIGGAPFMFSNAYDCVIAGF